MPFVVTDGQIRSAAKTPTLPPTGITLAGSGVRYLERVVAYDAIYRSQPAVRSVVDFLAKNIAALKADLYRGEDADDRERLRSHDLGQLLRRPLAMRRSRFAWFRAMVSDLAIYDAFVAAKVNLTSGAGGRGLLRIPPIHLKRIGDNYFDVDGFAITDGLGRTVTELARDDVLYVRGYSPSGDAVGVAPMETLRQVIAEELASSDYRRKLWRNGARVSGVIRRPADAPPWSDGARTRFLEEWAALWTGDAETAGGTPILEEGMEFAKVTMSAVEAEYLGARKLNREEVNSVFHVDGRLLGVGETGANAGAADAASRRGLYADTLGPWVTWLAEELAVALIPDYIDLDPAEDFIEFNLEAKLRGHFAEQAEVISRSVGGPWLTRDEARGMFNRPPLPDGEGAQIITPLNVTVGGRANPADTAPGTPGLGQANRLDAVIDVRELTGRTKAKGTPGGQLPPRLRAWVDRHVDELGKVIGDARQVVRSRLGAGQSIADAYNESRWAKQLTNAALGLGVAFAEAEAAATLDDLGEPDDAYDPALLTPWLESNSRILGEGMAERLEVELAEAWASASKTRRSKADEDLIPPADEGPTPAEAVDDAFGVFLAGRLLVEAATRVTTLTGKTREDVATTVGRQSKTWRVNSSNPRSNHAALNGVTVGIAERFPNGGLWPGDPALPVEERANCTCTIEFN